MAEFGVWLTATGARAAFPAPAATRLEVCVFADGRETRHPLTDRVGDVFAGDVPLGAGDRYGLRAHGPGLNPRKLLLDPWARRIDRAFALHPSLFDGADSAEAMPKAVLEAAVPALPPPSPVGARVIYEVSVRGFTLRHPEVPEALRGTFAGLAHPAAIAHLREIGVTHVELLPCAAWIDERHLPPLGLSNRWGYNPAALLAPDPRLAPGGMAEVRAAVAALASVGIAVILDVVLNHTGEGDADGPTLSLRGLGGPAWYHMRDGALENHAGTGNALALHRPWPLRLAMDALRHWASQGVAGFRLDLATTLGRREDGFDADAPLLQAMRQDPVLRDRLVIAEPWDIGPEGYQLGRFPPGWPEWNDRFRDDTRRFWRGDGGMLGAFTTRFAGSGDIFTGRPATDSLNFITAHDGFTLADLVSHETRHNEANGEGNRDGASENHSWNNGVEGKCDDPATLTRRAADVRALLLLLLTARGTPMLSMGDELGRTQDGNNNAYCQDVGIEWPGDAELSSFVARLVQARRAHPALHGAAPLFGTVTDGLPDVAWHHPSGGGPDWQGQALLALLSTEDDRVAVAFNAGREPLPLMLPQPRPGHVWRLLADSAAPDATAVPQMLTARGALLIAEERRARSHAPDDATLRALARAAGIQTHRRDAGATTAVPLETLRAVLDALAVPRASADEAIRAIRDLAMPPPFPRLPVLVADQEGALILGPDFQGDALEVALEGGGSIQVPLDAERHWHILPDGVHLPCRRAAMPPLPAGHHRLSAEGAEASLTVAPMRGFLPEGRFFGLAAQTYALRRAGDQGIGDYTAMGLLAAEAASAGARLLGISPPHALMPVDRERASPYQPSDRRFLEPILIDLATLPGASAALAAQAGLFQALAAGAVVDYPTVWAAKRRVLRAALAHAPPELDTFIAAGGEALSRFATFTAMAEAGGEPGMAHANDVGVAAFQRKHAEAIRFVQFQQFIADRQLGLAATAGAGLYRDLAVGSAPDGAEIWCSPEAFLRGFSLGVPPDRLGPQGQVWGLPAPRPVATPVHLAGLLAANTRHAAALRIDHVMALQRLFLVPDGANGAAGCYLAYPREALLAETTLASQRGRCLIIGEDLGTVPEGLGEALAVAEVLSYRVLWFQQDERGFAPPSRWTEKAAACVSTHDLPTLAGWWTGADLAERKALGLLEADEEASRATERAELIQALAHSGNLPQGVTTASDFSDALAAGIHGHVAGGACRMMLAQAEDLAGETMAVNLPGTDRERPNWRQRLSVAVPGLVATPRGQAIIAAIRAHRGAG